MSGLALEGVKVLDLQWVMAGPTATRVLADYGATIIHIESTKRVDTARTMAPFFGGVPGPENSVFFQNLNAGKRSITLDLSQEEGRAVALDLVRWCDVLAESFSPKAMRAWGLDYQSLRKVKPDLIMVSTCLMGQTGPLSAFAGFGSLAAAISGFYDVTGWPDRPPAGPFGAYTDTVAPRFMAAAILAALDHRRRTGQGQYIDQSQAESTLHFLAPALLDRTVNGRVQTRAGNTDATCAPHGVYPAAGDDRWVAIAVRDDPQWRALCAAMGESQLAEADRFSTPDARLAHRDELDEIVAQWTSALEPQEIERSLQALGVAASVVETGEDVYNDPQLAARGHYVEVEHPLHGPITLEGSRFRLSRTPARVQRAGPTYGQDNEHILKDILGYSEERIAGLVAGGILE